MKHPNYISVISEAVLCIIIGLSLFVSACSLNDKYAVYQYDNGDDYFSEDLQRIVDKDGKIGFRDSIGMIVIPPRYAFAFPFKEGYAKVTDTGHREAVDEAGEHHQWVSDSWYYINKTGRVLNEKETKLAECLNIDPEPYLYMNGVWNPYFGMAGLKGISISSIKNINIRNDEYGNRAVFVELPTSVIDSIRNVSAECFPYIETDLIFNNGEGDIRNEKEWIDTYKSVPDDFIGNVRVVVNYIVNQDGLVDSVTIFKSSGNQKIDYDAIKVIKNLPHYKVIYNSPRRIPVKRTISIKYESLQKSCSTNEKLKMVVVNPESLKIPVDSIVVKMINNADVEATFGEYFKIEKNSNGKWVRLPYNDRIRKLIEQDGIEMVFNDIGYPVRPYSSRIYSNPTKAYNETLTPGRYRISKTFTYPPYPKLKADTAYVEFEIR